MKKFLFLFLSLFFIGGLSVKAKTLAVDLSKLPATSENTTWAWDSESSTGTFAWSGTSYNSTELYGSGNYSSYTKLNLVTEAGTADHFRIILKFTNGAAQVTINPVAAGNVSLTLTDYTTLENLANVSTIRLSGANDATGDVSVKSISLEGPDIVYIEASEVFEAPAGTFDVKNLTGTEQYWSNSVAYPKEFAVQGQSFGNGDGSSESTHVNIEGYDYICFNVTTATGNTAGLRVWIWDGEAGGAGSVKTLYAKPIADYKTATWTEASKITGVGTYVAKVSGYKYLKGVKAANDWGSSAAIVSMAYMCTGDPVAYAPTGKYSLVGETTGSVTLTAALADANAVFYDATGVTGTGVDLTSVANSNALFKANAGVLANTKNVIVDGTCANLVLEDGKPFKAPADFTATSASYTTTINAGAQAGTLCLPFAAAIPEGVSAYTLTYSSGDKAKATAVEATIPANTPVLLNGSGEKTFTGASVDIDADAENVEGSLTGVFASATVPVNSYVLQKQGENVGFYRVDAEDPITIKPFRAYLTAAASARSISITYDGITGINDVKVNKVGEKDVYYNLNGQRVSNPTKGIFIKNGVKVYFE